MSCKPNRIQCYTNTVKVKYIYCLVDSVWGSESRTELSWVWTLVRSSNVIVLEIQTQYSSFMLLLPLMRYFIYWFFLTSGRIHGNTLKSMDLTPSDLVVETELYMYEQKELSSNGFQCSDTHLGWNTHNAPPLRSVWKFKHPTSSKPVPPVNLFICIEPSDINSYRPLFTCSLHGLAHNE